MVGGMGDIAHLLRAAMQTRGRARCTFSGFAVGAAIEDDRGGIYTGCNIENASYGLTICAERVAVFKAISEGAGTIVNVLVVADTKKPTPPCGACRQILWEFCPDAKLYLANISGQTEETSVPDIFPRAFDASYL